MSGRCKAPCMMMVIILLSSCDLWHSPMRTVILLHHHQGCNDPPDANTRNSRTYVHPLTKPCIIITSSFYKRNAHSAFLLSHGYLHDDTKSVIYV